MPRTLRALVALVSFVSAAAVAPAGAQQQRSASPAAAVPRAADGKPDFSGVWAGPGFSHTGPGDTDSPRVTTYEPKNYSAIKPGGEALLRRKLTGIPRVDDPTGFCLPNGLTRQLLSPYAQQWVQTPAQIVILYEYMHFFRIIPIGAPNRAHDPDVELTWMGDSIGWWEGDTLVIDTVGLKEWQLDASLDNGGGESKWHSDALHVVERVRYTEPALASYRVTIDDPKIFTTAWSQDFAMKRHPTWKILEFVCEENNRCQGGQCQESTVQK